MNWGKWIIVSFVLFALFIATLVTVCMRQEISLVSKDYYQEELAYQEQITRISNTLTLTTKPSISKVSGTKLEVRLNQKIDRGQLKLFCPSDSKMDRTFPLRLSADNQVIHLGALKSGMYRARIYWSAGGSDYFFEEVISI